MQMCGVLGLVCLMQLSCGVLQLCLMLLLIVLCLQAVPADTPDVDFVA
jgi:hypothetical protein